MVRSCPSAARARRVALALAWLALLASAGPACIIGGQTGQNEDSKGRSPDDCVDERSAIGPNDESALGFSPGSVVAQLGARRVVSFRWQREDEPMAGELELRYLGGAAFDVLSDCQRTLDVEVELVLRTQDGRLDERVAARLVVRREDSAELHAQIALDALSGNYDGAVDGAAELRGATVVIDAAFDSGESNGTVAISGTKSNGERVLVAVARWQTED